MALLQQLRVIDEANDLAGPLESFGVDRVATAYSGSARSSGRTWSNIATELSNRGGALNANLLADMRGDLCRVIQPGNLLRGDEPNPELFDWTSATFGEDLLGDQRGGSGGVNGFTDQKQHRGGAYVFGAQVAEG